MENVGDVYILKKKKNDEKKIRASVYVCYIPTVVAVARRKRRTNRGYVC